jgi:hypothetical protein
MSIMEYIITRLLAELKCNSTQGYLASQKGLHLLFFSPQASLSEATHPSVAPSIGVVVILGLVPCTPKVYPQGVG